MPHRYSDAIYMLRAAGYNSAARFLESLVTVKMTWDEQQPTTKQGVNDLTLKEK